MTKQYFYPISGDRRLIVDNGMIVAEELIERNVWQAEEDPETIEQLEAMCLWLLKELTATYREMLQFYCNPGTQAHATISDKLAELE